MADGEAEVDPEDEIFVGVDLGSTKDVTVFATITKDGRVIDTTTIQHREPWIANLEPFDEGN